MARLVLANTPTETTPDAGLIAIYAKANNNLYLKDETGAERLIFDSSSAAGTGYKVDYFALDLGDILAKEVILPQTPHQTDQVLVSVRGGGPCFFNIDYTVVGNAVSWNGYDLESILELGDILQIIYSV